MVQLVTMSDARYQDWRHSIWKSYFQELVRSGLSEAAAQKNVDDNIAATMPEGVLQPGNEVFEIHHDGESIGVVWLWQDGTEWFVYDIDLEEQHRGKGLGRKTMQAIEAHVRAHGGTAIALSVFGFNQVARNLYESEGYETTRLQMKKTLS